MTRADSQTSSDKFLCFRCIGLVWYSGLQHRVIWSVTVSVSKGHTSSIFSVVLDQIPKETKPPNKK